MPDHHILSIATTNGEQIKGAVFRLRCGILLLLWSPVNPAIGLPLFRGFQSTKEGSLRSPNWPTLHEQGFVGICKNEHCQLFATSRGELLK